MLASRGATVKAPGKVMFPPLIDLTTSDPTCVRSSLVYVANHA